MDSKDSLPLAGASVSIKGTAIATSTNSNGAFEININDSLERKTSSLTLRISFLGYTSTEVQINNISTNSITVKLKDNGGSLTEVVVVGYGTTKKLGPAENVSFPWPTPDFSTRTLLDRAFFESSKKSLNSDSYLSQFQFYYKHFYLINRNIRKSALHFSRKTGCESFLHGVAFCNWFQAFYHESHYKLTACRVIFYFLYYKFAGG